jgi:FlaA1/EpsC-like NDP-sugar epimerase
MEIPPKGSTQDVSLPLLDRLFTLPRRSKQAFLLAFDLLAIPLSAFLALLLRQNSYLDVVGWREAAAVCLTLIASAAVFVRIGLYRAVVRYMGQQAIGTVLKGVFWSTAALTVALFAMRSGVPRSLPLIYGSIVLFLIGGSRLLVRTAYQNLYRWRGVKVAIYGAGTSGRQLMQSLFQSGEYAPMVFLDDDPALQGAVINGVPIYAPAELPRLIAELDIATVLLAIPTAEPYRRRQIIEWLEQLPVQIKTVPSFSVLVSGLSDVGQLLDLDVEDLLGRAPVPPRRELLDQCVRAKTVLVTGAGGSIGSELCRQILRCEPTRLVLFDSSEFALYQIERELAEFIAQQKLATELVALLGNVQNEERLSAVCRHFRIQSIYHSAAYKHVPIVEGNVAEGVLNNVFGTQAAVRAAAAARVETFVLISTDKAVRPTNIMGASKRLAEMIVQAAAHSHSGTRFSVVRFGNVLGSSGSVVPLFREQINRGGPVTVTHPEVQRYFMTIPEAAQLVLQAGAMEGIGNVFVLDMGEPVRIIDLARRMVRLMGYSVRDIDNPDGDIEVRFVGLRPGEKMFEELLLGDKVSGTAHPKILRADEEWMPEARLNDYLQRLRRACVVDDCRTVQHILAECVHDYPAAAPLHDAIWKHSQIAVGTAPQKIVSLLSKDGS